MREYILVSRHLFVDKVLVYAKTIRNNSDIPISRYLVWPCLTDTTDQSLLFYGCSFSTRCSVLTPKEVSLELVLLHTLFLVRIKFSS